MIDLNWLNNIAVITEVPQGSHVAPLLSNVYINVFLVVMKNCKFLIFDDDVKISKSIQNVNDCHLL